MKRHAALILILILFLLCTLTLVASSVNLAWDASPTAGATYQVFRAISAGAYGAPLNATPLAGTTYVDGAVLPGAQYFYIVKAMSGGVLSAPSNEVSVSIPPIASAPTWTFCASEGQACSFVGTKQVRYGANGIYATLTLPGPVNCSNDVFGDPVFGVAKGCDVIDVTVQPPTNLTIAIVTPTNGQILLRGTIPVQVQASANATTVKLYRGTTLLTTQAGAALSYGWKITRRGSYTLTAKAYDITRKSAASSITVTVN